MIEIETVTLDQRDVRLFGRRTARDMAVRRAIDALPPPPKGWVYEYAGPIPYAFQMRDPHTGDTRIECTFKLLPPQLRHPLVLDVFKGRGTYVYVQAKPRGSVLK